MKPPPFAYHAPRTVDEAVEILNLDRNGSKVLAGGQSLVPMLNLRLARVDNLVDLNRIEGLDYIRFDDGTIAIGAGARQYQVERSGEIRKALPLLSAALAHVGHFQIRNRGTVVGSICHADPAAELPAIWLAVGGELVARSASGTRTITPEEFFISYLTTSLEDNEIATEVRFNVPPRNTGWSFNEVSRRHGDFAIVGVATLISLARGAVSDARIAVLGAGPTPVRIAAAEQLLVGTSAGAVNESLLEAAAAAVAGAVTPSDDIHGSAEYRRHVAGVLTRRGIAESLERAGSKA